ncbi:insulinase family protein [Taibaiella lutea]|uniref:Insulinase family protein n=1 Tax=Taibaiella lutea TaxID=2608001 RepID=A0A5M6CER6_9BACT|nr:insulinase family protein [Taibaiella lutea]KAA5533688.1 insulinase family protein [Taibaiella lutea]
MFKNFLSKAALACLFTSATFSAYVVSAQTSKTEKLPVDPKTKIGKLPNGLTYYIRPNSKPEKKVELRLILNAGSILENDNQQGLAHFMEHMNFNGTKNFPKNKLVDFLQSIGVEFGADLNAYTSFDETVFILPIPTDKPGNLESGFQVIEDWAHNANLTEQDINDERNVVLEESRLGKGADDRMSKKYLPKLFAGSHYANRLPIGIDSILRTFKPEAIRAFYHDWYRPDLMAVAVVGDITVPEAEALIKKHFGGMTNPANERKRNAFEVPTYPEASAMVLTDKEATNYAFQLFFPVKKETVRITLDDYRSNLIQTLFTQVLNRRLQELTQSATPPFSFASTFANSFLRGYESFGVFGMPADDIQTSVNAIVGELVKAETYGFNNSELEIVKKQFQSSVEKSYNERDKTPSSRLVDEYIRNFLTKEPIPGIENEYNYVKTMLPTITINEVNAEAKKWLNKGNYDKYFALITGPDAKKMPVPTDIELKEMVDNAFQQKVNANEEKKVATSILDKEPVAGKIVSEATDKELGATTFTLSNGVKVTIKKTDFKSDEITLEAVKKGGYNNYGAADKSNTKFLPDVIEAMGYGNFTPTQLEDLLSGKTVSLVPEMDDIYNEIKGNSSVKDFESLLQLTYLQLTSPRTDEDLFKGFINTQKTQLQFLSQNPQIAFIDTMLKTVYHNDPLTPIQVPTVQDVDKIDMNRVVDIYKNEFSNADGLHFFIVGNIDESTIRPLLEKYIASLPANGSQPTMKDNGLRPISGNNSLVFNKGEEQKSLVLMMNRGELPYTESLALQTQMIADILSISVIENVREKMGAIYGGGFQGQFEQYPYAHYSLSGYFPCGPENVDPIMKEANKEIEDLKKNGPSQKDLDKVKLAIVEKRKENIKTNTYWNNKLEQLLFWNESKDRFLNFETELNKITVSDIKATANKLFDGKNSFNAVLQPAVVKTKG